ncbi:discoidin domain-containing protein [Neptuniibacter sp. QD37_11]|uniref:discoidin domain-containing protein n=1 Tax=Neptuniibacter sp. QD37_11 TaxID=3398209 RepID=UPI0039F62252
MKKQLTLAITLATLSSAAMADFVYRTPAGMQVGSAQSEEGGAPAGGHSSTCGSAVIGDQCSIEGQDVYYVGDYSGERLYMALANESGGFEAGHYNYSTAATTTDGAANSRIAFDAIFSGQGIFNPIDGYTNNAYLQCMNRGSNWFIPSREQIKAMSDNLQVLDGGITPFGINNVYYMSSSQRDANSYYATHGHHGGYSWNYKNGIEALRCFAKDEEGKLLATGPNNNVAQIGTNGLVYSSYTASSTYGSDVPAGAFDGFQYQHANPEDGAVSGRQARGIWFSTGAYPKWIQVDFGEGKKVKATGMAFNNRYANEGFAGRPELIRNATVQISDDGVTFTDHESVTDLSQDSNVVWNFSSVAEARYVRLQVESNWGGSYLHVGEIQIFE